LEITVFNKVKKLIAENNIVKKGIIKFKFNKKEIRLFPAENIL